MNMVLGEVSVKEIICAFVFYLDEMHDYMNLV